MNFNLEIKSKTGKSTANEKFMCQNLWQFIIIGAVFRIRSIGWMLRNLFILFRRNALISLLFLTLLRFPSKVRCVCVSISFPLDKHRHRVRFVWHFIVHCLIYTCSQINRWQNDSHHHSQCYWHFTNIFIQTFNSVKWQMLRGFGSGMFRKKAHTHEHSHIMKTKSIKFFSSTVFQVCVHTFHFGCTVSHIFWLLPKPTLHWISTSNIHTTIKSLI